MPGEMPQATTADYRPPDNCRACRLGTMTVPTTPGDIRGWQEVETYAGDGPNYDIPWVRLHRTQVVQSDGPVPCPIMLIGEAPGAQEDREGRGFVPTAPAGRVLRAALDEVGLERGVDVYVTNAVKCRPPDNKIGKVLDCLEVCRSLYLTREIEVVDPRVVVCLGKTAAQPWFGSQGSLAFRQVGRRLFIHAPHPSYIARGVTEARALLIEALQYAKDAGYR